jgi:hypothetical protein
LQSFVHYGNSRRVLTAIVLLLSLFVAVAIPLYLTFGEQLIRDIYAGKSLGLLNSLISQQDRFPVEHYLELVDSFFWKRIIGFPLTFLFAALVYWILRYFFLRLDDPVSNQGNDDISITEHDWLLATAVYCLLTAVYFYPCLPTLGTHLIGPPEDNIVGYWDIWWSNDQVLPGDRSLSFSNLLFYPEGSSLYYVAWSFYNLLLSFPLRLLCGNVAVYNLIILHSFPLAGIGAFLLLRYLTRNSWLAFLGGFIFAFSPYHFVRAQHHFHINTLQFVPFFVLFFIKTVREGTRKNLILATFFFLLNALADWNYLFFAGYFIVFSYIYLAVRRRRVVLWDIIRKSAVVVGLPLLILSPWLIPMIWIGIAHKEATLLGHNFFVTDLVGLIVPNHYHWLNVVGFINRINASYTGNPWEVVSYLGLASIVIVARTFRRILRQTAPFFIGGIAFLIMAMGVNPHIAGAIIPVRLPDQVLCQLPFLSNLRCPVRFMSYVYLFWSIIVVIAAKSLIESAPSSRRKLILTILLPTLLVADFFNICHDKTEVFMPPCYQVIAADNDRFGILNLPEGYEESCRYMMYQTLHGLPIANGAITRKIGKSLIDVLDTTDLDIQYRQLCDSKVKYIVVHKDLLKSESFKLDKYRRCYRQQFEDDRSIVFRVY